MSPNIGVSVGFSTHAGFRVEVLDGPPPLGDQRAHIISGFLDVWKCSNDSCGLFSFNLARARSHIHFAVVFGGFGGVLRRVCEIHGLVIGFSVVDPGSGASFNYPTWIPVLLMM